MQTINRYYDLERSERAAKEGRHRVVIGGFWDEIGKLYLDTILEHGLRPDMKVLDLGCGCLRVGIPLIKYLDKNMYFGTDISKDLLDAGYEIELRMADLQPKLPRHHLILDEDFKVGNINEVFDVAIASSLFTHLPLKFLKLCLKRMSTRIRPGGKIFASFFVCEDDQDWSGGITHIPGKVTSYPDKDPYHYRIKDLEDCSHGRFWRFRQPWNFNYVGDWGHPRGQKLVIYTRT